MSTPGNKLSFPSFSIFSFLLQLPISSSVSQIIRELCSSSSSSSSYSFHFHHLSFHDITKEVISSLNMTDPIGVSTQDIYYLEVFTSLLYVQEHVLNNKNSNYIISSVRMWDMLLSVFNSHVSQWTYFDGLPQKQDQLGSNRWESTIYLKRSQCIGQQ